MTETVLTLPEGTSSTLSERQLRDLLDYTEPGCVIVHDDLSPRRRRWLELRADAPLLFTTDPGWEFINNRTYLIANSPGDLPDTVENPENLRVISSFIESDVDPHSFSVTWQGIEAYRQFARDLPADARHLAVNQPPGKTIPLHEDEDIHGSGTDPERIQFPHLTVQPSVYLEESLSHSKLGLRAIKGIGRSKARTLRKNGFETRRALETQTPFDLLELDGFGPYYASTAVAGARAHETETPLWFDDDPLEDRRRVYVDIETDSTGVTNIWLIGVYDESTETYRSFLQTEDPGDAETVPSRFARWVYGNAADKTFVAWFGKRFDFRWLDRFVDRYAEDAHARAWQQTDRIDLLLDLVKPRLALPVRSHKLDVVARRLGYERAHEGIDGGDAARAYSRWCSGKEPDWGRWIAYCKDDVMGMKYIYDRIKSSHQEFDIREVRDHYQASPAGETTRE
ncbi:MAG: ribonuclease H-like domain-containing protein [bacterium]